MVNLKCSSCGARFSVDLPNTSGVHSVCCPMCSAAQELTVRVNQPKTQDLSPEELVVAKVRRYVLFSGIVWLLLGIVQICFIYTAASGVWNVFFAVRELRNRKNITAGNAAVVSYFDGQKVPILIAGAVNLFLGAVVGVVFAIFDWSMREYVLKHRSAFEG